MHHTKEGKYICICHVVGGKKSSKHSEMKQILDEANSAHCYALIHKEAS